MIATHFLEVQEGVFGMGAPVHATSCIHVLLHEQETRFFEAMALRNSSGYPGCDHSHTYANFTQRPCLIYGPRHRHEEHISGDVILSPQPFQCFALNRLFLCGVLMYINGCQPEYRSSGNNFLLGRIGLQALDDTFPGLRRWPHAARAREHSRGRIAEHP